MGGVDLLVSLLKVGAVLALLVLALRVLARYQQGKTGAGRRTGPRGASGFLDVIDQTRLGRTASAVAVRAGDRVLLLGVSEAGVAHLADLTDDIDLSEPEEGADQESSVLDHALELLRSNSLRG